MRPSPERPTPTREQLLTLVRERRLFCCRLPGATGIHWRYNGRCLAVDSEAVMRSLHADGLIVVPGYRTTRNLLRGDTEFHSVVQLTRTGAEALDGAGLTSRAQRG